MDDVGVASLRLASRALREYRLEEMARNQEGQGGVLPSFDGLYNDLTPGVGTPGAGPSSAGNAPARGAPLLAYPAMQGHGQPLGAYNNHYTLQGQGAQHYGTQYQVPAAPQPAHVVGDALYNATPSTIREVVDYDKSFVGEGEPWKFSSCKFPNSKITYRHYHDGRTVIGWQSHEGAEVIQFPPPSFFDGLWHGTIDGRKFLGRGPWCHSLAVLDPFLLCLYERGGTLPGGYGLTIRDTTSYLYRRRFVGRGSEVIKVTEGEYGKEADLIRAFVHRDTRYRYGNYRSLGDALDDDFDSFCYRSPRDLEYLDMLCFAWEDIKNRPDDFVVNLRDPVSMVDRDALVVTQVVPRDFRFKPWTHRQGESEVDFVKWCREGRSLSYKGGHLVDFTDCDEYRRFNRGSAKDTRFARPPLEWNQVEAIWGMFGIPRSPALQFMLSHVVPKGNTQQGWQVAHQSPVWHIIITDHIAYLVGAWMRYLYSTFKMWRLQPSLIAAIRALGVDGLAQALGTERNARDCLELVTRCENIAWTRFPAAWRSNTRERPHEGELTGPLLPGCSYVPYDPWARRVLPGREWMFHLMHNHRVMPQGHPIGVAKANARSSVDGRDARRWPTHLNGVLVTYNGDPCGLDDPGRWPPLKDNTHFTNDGNLVAGSHLDAQREWWGNEDNPQLQPPEDEETHDDPPGGNDGPGDNGGGGGPPGGGGYDDTNDDDDNTPGPQGGGTRVRRRRRPSASSRKPTTRKAGAPRRGGCSAATVAPDDEVYKGSTVENDAHEAIVASALIRTSAGLPLTLLHKQCLAKAAGDGLLAESDLETYRQAELEAQQDYMEDEVVEDDMDDVSPAVTETVADGRRVTRSTRRAARSKK